MTPRYKKLLDGKSIALLGGHDAIDWERTNGADLVVRVNSHWKRQGGRCDVLYFSCADDLDYEMFDNALAERCQYMMLNKMHVMFGIGTYHWVRGFCRDHNIPSDEYFHATRQCYALAKDLNPIPEEQKWLRDFCTAHDTYPYTGILAVHHLTLADIKSLYVDGINFYKENGELPRGHGVHSSENQLKYLDDLITEDKRVEFSQTLTDIMYDWRG